MNPLLWFVICAFVSAALCGAIRLAKVVVDWQLSNERSFLAIEQRLDVLEGDPTA